MSMERSEPVGAGPELLCLQKWEEFTGWLLEHTAKWPKSARFSFVQKVDLQALAVLEALVAARYEPAQRRGLLREVNLRLEQLRFLLRMARGRAVMPAAGFEIAMREIDGVGRMVHGWRVAIGERAGSSRGETNRGEMNRGEMNRGEALAGSCESTPMGRVAHGDRGETDALAVATPAVHARGSRPLVAELDGSVTG